jgi:flagellar protein FliO/FliZ
VELEQGLRALFALVAVIGLIGLLGLGLRRFAPASLIGGRPGKRLSVVEALTLDPKRRLVLVRRDGVEHLLLVGPETAMVVERGITPPVEPAQAEQKEEQA